MMDGLSDGHGFGKCKAPRRREESLCGRIFVQTTGKEYCSTSCGPGQGKDTDGESLVPRSNYFLLGMIVFTLLMAIMVVDVKMF